MQMLEEKHARSFRSTGEMIASVAGGDPLVAVCPCTLQVQGKTNWLYLILGVIAVVVFQVLAQVSGDVGLAVGLVVIVIGGFLALRAFLKGYRNSADALAISNQNVYLFKEVIFNKKTGTFTFNNAYKAGRNELKKKFIFQLFGSAMRFKAGDITCIAAKPGRGKAQHYGPGNVISVKEAKRLLFP